MADNDKWHCIDREEVRQVFIQHEGACAFHAGIERRNNPYPVLSTEWENWLEGWTIEANKVNK